jgi:hypothetical protein
VGKKGVSPSFCALLCHSFFTPSFPLLTKKKKKTYQYLGVVAHQTWENSHQMASLNHSFKVGMTSTVYVLRLLPPRVALLTGK